MDFFSHTLGPFDYERLGAYIWVRDSAYTPRKKWLKQPFNRTEYEKDPFKHRHFMWINNQFMCGNLGCKNEDVVCIWFTYDGIALGVDQTFGEFYCERCGKYTFVEYQRDSS